MSKMLEHTEKSRGQPFFSKMLENIQNQDGEVLARYPKMQKINRGKTLVRCSKIHKNKRLNRDQDAREQESQEGETSARCSKIRKITRRRS